MARTVAYKLCSWCDEHQGSRPIPEIAPKLPRCIIDVQYDICIIYICMYMHYIILKLKGVSLWLVPDFLLFDSVIRKLLFEGAAAFRDCNQG